MPTSARKKAGMNRILASIKLSKLFTYLIFLEISVIRTICEYVIPGAIVFIPEN